MVILLRYVACEVTGADRKTAAMLPTCMLSAASSCKPGCPAHDLELAAACSVLCIVWLLGCVDFCLLIVDLGGEDVFVDRPTSWTP